MNTRTESVVERKPRAKNGAAHGAPTIPAGKKSRGKSQFGDLASWSASAADTADLCRALADRQHQLDQALQHIGELDRDVARLTLDVAHERQYAYYDPLTGLPNRRLLLDRFNQAVARGARQHKQMALLFLDLDGFKGINDSLGHEIGDLLLKQVAERLVSCIRTSDTVCRYGGDEFVVLLAEIQGQKSALAAAKKIRACLARPYALNADVIHLTASIGLAVYPIDGAGYTDLIERSDLAMYFDKSRCPSATGKSRSP
jgi:diguanylate cyclase (GGDEF)-like protein